MLKAIYSVCAAGAIMVVYAACGGSRPADEVEHASPTLFTDVTEEAGLQGFAHSNGGFGEAWAPEIVGAGAGFLDYDGDRWQDLVLVAGGSFAGHERYRGPCVRLFRNLGDGTFEETTGQMGLHEAVSYAFGVTVGDYDNDGDPDLFVATLYRDLLLRNDDGRRFVEVGQEVGVGAVSEWSTSAMFVDADHDGWLDLYVGTYVSWSPDTDHYCGFDGEKVYCTPEVYDGIASRYYRNMGDGTFRLWTAEAGFLSGIDARRDKTLGVAAFDANGDGLTDVAVANDTERDLLFMNDGDGTFTETGIRSGIAYDLHGVPRAGMGIDIGVVDPSGEPSWFVGNFSGEMVGVYRHTGDGLFMDRAAASLVGRPTLKTLTFGLFLFDVDLDGDLDLFVVNGHVQTHIDRIVEGITFRQRAQLFFNDGSGRFSEAPAEGALAAEMVARGATYADFDKDGDLDVVVTENDGRAHLWRNETQGKTWLRVRLQGRVSSRDGYGATVVVTSGGMDQVRTVSAGSSYLSHLESVATFGLGSIGTVDSVAVYWPSGMVDVVRAPASGSEIVVTEGATDAL